MKLLFATTNQGKLNEARQLLSDLASLELLSVTDFPALSKLDVEETGLTFEENALLKAKAYGDLAQISTIAEDAGLEIDILNGQPGVKSARFAATADERNQKILKLMSDEKNRSARFKSIFCLYNPQTKAISYFSGKIEGQISTEIKGDAGFDYDYIFIPDDYTQTFAELGSAVKNKISHRQQALEKLKTLVLSLASE